MVYKFVKPQEALKKHQETLKSAHKTAHNFKTSVYLDMSFILKNATDKSTSIILYYRKGLKGERFRYSTGEVINSEHWDNDSQRAILKNIPEEILKKNKNINFQIEKYDKHLEKAVSYADKHDIIVTKEYLQKEFDKEFSIDYKEPVIKAAKQKSTSFYDMIDVFIKDSKSGKRLTDKATKISNRRIQKYETLQTQLQEWKPKINITDIDMDFYSDWIAHRMKDEMTKNTIGMDIKILKSILRYTHEKKFHENTIYANKKFKAFSEHRDNVYNDDDELDTLWNLKLTGAYEIVRDVYIIGCYTGLRISDLSTLDDYHIDKKGKTLNIIQKKGGGALSLAIHPRVNALIKKYGGKFPVALADPTMNEYIKNICKDADIKDRSEYIITRGGSVVRTVEEKWQRITMHTARRTFATNMMLQGFAPQEIMPFTGHKHLKDFMLYICVSKELVARKMATHPYFQEKEIKKPAKKKKVIKKKK